LGIAYIAVGLFLHVHWFWGLHPRLYVFCPVLKLATAIVFLGSFGFAIYRIVL